MYKNTVIALLSIMLLTSCGMKNFKTINGDSMSIQIEPANAQKGRVNPTAHMLLFKSHKPVTRYKEILLNAAKIESGCKPIESTFVFINSGNTVAAVELNCKSKT
jgi:hypothetical protein